MDQNLKKNFDLNSATSGVGLAEASKQLKMASAKSYPTGGRVQIKNFFQILVHGNGKFLKI